MVSRNIKRSITEAVRLGSITIFGWLIVQGALALLPKIVGATSIIIGVIGLVGIIYLSNKR